MEMELGKQERETSTRDIFWKEKLKIPSESGFLRFTFVPSFGKLPTQFCIADDVTTVQAEAVSESQALRSGNKGNGEATSCTKSSHVHFQPKEPNTIKGRMEANDLFKAEFVFITDSDEDKKATVGNSYGQERSKILDTPYMSTSGKSRREMIDPQLSHTELPHNPASQQQPSQLTSPLSTSGHLSHKSPVTCLLSPTILKVEPDSAPSLHQASSLQESHSQWQSSNGSSIQQSSTYIQSTASYSSPSSITKRPPFPFHSLSDSAQLPSSLQAGNLHKISEPNWSLLPNNDSPPQAPSSAASLQSSSPQALSPPPSKRFTVLSAVPMNITTHLLSPSPQPLSSPFHGSSSTICSINYPCSQTSSSGNLLKSGIRSPVPTRLSLLTAILKSASSPKRPFSPDSCPATLSPSSLGSSTPTTDQKFKTTPPIPKKCVSSFSIRADSPGQDEVHLSVFSTTPNHMDRYSKSSPTLGIRSLSPKWHLDARACSPDKLRPLSPTISSYRKTVVSPLLQPKLPSFSLPPHAPRNASSLITSKGVCSPAHRTRGPEKSKRVHSYSPTFTATSFPVSSPAPNQRNTRSPTSEKGSSLSPALKHPTSKSRERLPKVSVKNSNTHSPAPSAHWPFSHTDATSPSRPNYNVKPLSTQINSSSVHSSYRACPASSRPRTPTVTQPRSPPMAHSPCSLLSRSRELTSPLSFSLPSDPDNKTPKSHKIKTSYKAFAAIPTNTLLLEQKALDEPTKMEGVGEDSDLDTHSEVCSPAQLRQQTEELCAAIDQVLQDPLSMRRCDSSPSSLQSVLDSDIGKISTASQRPGGRKTKFANLNLLAPTVTESQRTKPGVIRPTTVKAKIILKEEEPVQPNPFKKYLEETSDLQMEQDSSLFHPFPHTKLNLSTKSPLHPQFISHADSLTPGPFSHLSSIFGDTHDNSYSPYRRNALYNKPTHPIVPIPENEALSSKELHSAPVHNENDLLPHQENKSLSKGNFRDNGSPSSRAHSLLSREPVDVFAKSSC
ncbi:muscular LMNA-interacting protein isoform X3 [Hemicordylus capensis]|uniref:muscular LMNA-interacting protein isoform X3 n=1 Tax=Hemicordylus capensis TaxID=884348 RepID=UPI0023049CC3|nr:muscular LMNA-interacting protein isoform X3 [Hemicordylus capensis]